MASMKDHGQPPLDDEETTHLEETAANSEMMHLALGKSQGYVDDKYTDHMHTFKKEMADYLQRTGVKIKTTSNSTVVVTSSLPQLRDFEVEFMKVVKKQTGVIRKRGESKKIKKSQKLQNSQGLQSSTVGATSKTNSQVFCQLKSYVSSWVTEKLTDEDFEDIEREVGDTANFCNSGKRFVEASSLACIEKAETTLRLAAQDKHHVDTSSLADRKAGTISNAGSNASITGNMKSHSSSIKGNGSIPPIGFEFDDNTAHDSNPSLQDTHHINTSLADHKAGTIPDAGCSASITGSMKSICSGTKGRIGEKRKGKDSIPPIGCKFDGDKLHDPSSIKELDDARSKRTDSLTDASNNARPSDDSGNATEKKARHPLNKEFEHEQGAKYGKNIKTVNEFQIDVGKCLQDLYLSYFTKEGVEISVAMGDITRVKTDVMVNAANAKLDHAGGVASAIAKAGGKQITQDCKDYIKRHGELRVGEHCTTSGGKLPCQYVIHAVAPVWGVGKEYQALCVEVLHTMLLNILQYASCMMKMPSLTLPAIGAGIYGMPLDVNARVFHNVVKQFSSTYSDNDKLKHVQILHIDEDAAGEFILEFSGALSDEKANDRHAEASHAYGRLLDGNQQKFWDERSQSKHGHEQLQIRDGDEQTQILHGDEHPQTRRSVEHPQTRRGDEHPQTRHGDEDLQTHRRSDEHPQTRRGDEHPQTRHGDELLQTRHGDEDLQTHRRSDEHPQTRRGDEHPQTRHGDELLQTRRGDEHPQTRHGDELLQTRHGDEDLQTHRRSDEHPQTRRGDELLQTRHGDELLQTRGDEHPHTHHTNPYYVTEQNSEESGADSTGEIIPSSLASDIAISTQKQGDCDICAEDNTSLKSMKCCKNTICVDCFDRHFENDGKCPFCTAVVLIRRGNQPNGEMDVDFRMKDHLPGYNGKGTIVIDYSFPSGVQEKNHPNPGQNYSGTSRRAYLPADRDGKEILNLLKRAFDSGLLFTIGKSVTTGMDNCVVWNDVHHKTSRTGGAARHGYPDPTYLFRVREELAAKGIK